MRKTMARILVAAALTVVAATKLAAAANDPAPAAAEPSGGDLRKEIFAFVRMYGYLDGPRLEAQGGKSSNMAWDEKGNIYFFSSFGYGAIRCIRTDGRIVTVSGNDYWTSMRPLDEGLAADLGDPTGGNGYHYSYATGAITVQGVPDEGGDKGSIYVSDMRDGVVRVFRNKDKEDRWCFEQIAGGGQAPAPAKRGQSVPARDVSLGRVRYVQMDLENKLWIYAQGSFLRYEDGKLTCLLGPEDYLGKGGEGPKKPCREGYLGGDGSFYLGTYHDGEGFGGKGVAVYRATVSPDGIKVEPYAKAQDRGNVRDGDALKQSSWHCGPHFAPGWNETRYVPPNVLITSANDEAALRRIVDGRVSTLCKDGEWHEIVGKGRGGEAPQWFHGWRIGPDGTSYQYYSGGDHLHECQIYRITGIDLTKPTVK